jgi:hypothetical protein
MVLAEGLLERDEKRAESTIKYDALPENLRGPITHYNPDPNAEWAAEAFRTKVLNSKGKNTVIYAIIDGIDDEGATISLYTTSGKEIASADTTAASCGGSLLSLTIATERRAVLVADGARFAS